MKMRMALLIATTVGCGSSSYPLIQYSHSDSFVPDTLTSSSNLKDEAKDFLELYSKASEICKETSAPKISHPRVMGAGGSCDKGQCYYSISFRCEG